ncbi:protein DETOXIFICATION 29-like [Cornus florida]|uniref:protein DETOXIFICATION 29-like n=1 Tax=Cornus florida TaxID=4283 RepID=UPI0028A13CAE|nr:protein DETOXIFICATION 29-like [Cornus florida]
MENCKQPLLSQSEDEQMYPDNPHGILIASNSSFYTSSFVVDENDIQPINGVRDFFREFKVESWKLWYIAGPAIFTSICQYTLGFITQTFAGHLGTLELAAISIENNVIAALSIGIMLGMGSALETLCGQAFGAGQINMLGIYMQRSWLILNATALILMQVYIFAAPLLRLIGQTDEISEAAGTLAVWMIPQLFAYAMNFPISKFLQAQSKITAMAVISAVALLFHTFFSWLFMLKLGWGLVGGAIVLNLSWWFIVVAQLLYILSGTCGSAWSGFSWKAFQNLWGFVRLSLASAVMICLEIWYLTVLILFAGFLKNAEVSVDAFSICMNILGWIIMEAIGLNAAVGVRVSNELGAAHPRTAKFSVIVVGITSFLFGLFLAMILMITQKQYPSIFTDNAEVKELVYELTPLLALSIVINNVQPALSGVAIGAGWQALVAYVNIGCYYVFGVPVGLIMGYKLGMGVKGIWWGMLCGTVLQLFVLFWIIYKTNWKKEASIAGERIKQWGGESDVVEHDVERRNRDEKA